MDATIAEKENTEGVGVEKELTPAERAKLALKKRAGKGKSWGKKESVVEIAKKNSKQKKKGGAFNGGENNWNF